MKYALFMIVIEGSPLFFEGSCVPDKCTAEDLDFVTDELNKAIQEYIPEFKAEGIVIFPEELVSNYPMQQKDLLACFIIAVLGGLLVFGTVVQYSTLFQRTDDFVRSNSFQ